jgi:uncharacterized protein DUF2330
MSLMRKACLGSMVAALAALAHPNDADACGGCFVPPDANTQVTGHRMILSVGMDQSTLYDQIEYAGNPAEFAWVLPIQGTVEVGLSSDLIFNQLAFDSDIQILPPVLDCPSYYCPGWGEDDGLSASAGPGTGGGGGASGGGVDVLAQEVVGPFETVQLSSSDPSALADWLAGHGYNVPSDIQPIIDDYVAEGFNFFAMKLVPGAGIDKMRPIRITTPGAGIALPLRMVAAGTGATTTVTLFVVGDGRYEPTNFPSFVIPEDVVVWNYSTSESNYTQLRQDAYDASDGFAWLTEAAFGYSIDAFSANIYNVIDFLGPVDSGYDDGTGDYDQAHQAAEADLLALFGNSSDNQAYVTRLRAELSRPALTTDLAVGAATDQSSVDNILQTTQWVGSQPPCPPPPDCDGVTVVGSNDEGDTHTVTSSCAMERPGQRDDAMLAGGILSLLALVTVRRRRR